TPLNGILGLTSLLKGNQLDQDQHDHYLDVINLSGHSLLNILQSILDYTRLDSANIEAEIKDENIQTICEEVIQLFIPIVERKDLNLTIHFKPGTPVWACTDGARLRQILLNLIGNAEKFTDAGQIKLTVSADEKWLRFEIEDTGIGIAEDKLSGLFQPFNQVDSTATRRHGGAGMGLSLCKRLVDVLGGGIGVRSQLNKGSIFWFTLPYRESKQTPASSANDAIFAAVNQKVDWAAKKALIVEDNAVNRMVVMGMLKKLGLPFESAENGLQALEIVTTSKTSFDLILMDCDMPVMDGYTATEKIREWEKRNELPALPIIALTAQIAPEHVNRALRAGMTAHLGKPISVDKLETTMQRFLNYAASRQQSSS
ncbi:MAG TPA: ATP-binding protein, partial [Pseudomonadales bacterium]|nr:ATP-binding protein [Pseudomonadales bacterium]